MQAAAIMFTKCKNIVRCKKYATIMAEEAVVGVTAAQAAAAAVVD